MGATGGLDRRLLRMAEQLTVTRSGGVVTATITNPELKNALDNTGFDALFRLADEVSRNQDDRCLVLTGAGDAFCSGADISALGLSTHPLHFMRDTHSAVLALHRIPKPVVAKVNGVAAGIGLSLALGCDLVVASDQARFTTVFAKRGLNVDGGLSWLLPRIVGLQKAKQLTYLSEMLSAADAERMGLVTKVVPHDQLDAKVDELAAKLVAGPPLALSLNKTLLNGAFSWGIDEALEHESRSQTVCLGSADVVEAMAAFKEKREPRFEGK